MEQPGHNGLLEPAEDQLLERAAVKMAALQAESAEEKLNGLPDGSDSPGDQTSNDSLGADQYKNGDDSMESSAAGESSEDVSKNGAEHQMLDKDSENSEDAVDPSHSPDHHREESDQTAGRDSPLAGLVDDTSRLSSESSQKSDECKSDTKVGDGDDCSLNEDIQKSPSEHSVDECSLDTGDPVDSDKPSQSSPMDSAGSPVAGTESESTDKAGDLVEKAKEGGDVGSSTAGDEKEVASTAQQAREPPVDRSSEQQAKKSVVEVEGSGQGVKKKVEKIVDDDGSEFIITVNEEVDSDSDKEEGGQDIITIQDKKDKPQGQPRAEGPVVAKDTNRQQNIGVNRPPAPPNNVPVVTNSVNPSMPVFVPVMKTGDTQFRQNTPGYYNMVSPYSLPTPQSTAGLITRVGSQTIFVPMTAGSKMPAGQTVAAINSQRMVGVPRQQRPQLPPPKSRIPEKIEMVTPKSSLDQIELMKWEVQNRIPDNYNWSVVFHPKKDAEITSLASFMLELGHDVVKEAVYKDIIQIQTKKKDLDKLKEGEIESLEKMKSVYEDTRKKVEHLHLKSHRCNKCKFHTESLQVMAQHKDYPHYDPPKDTNGTILCSHCDWSTKNAAEFAFHMEAMHSLKARMQDKPDFFQCELCPFESGTKNKVTKHKFKCIKHFKLNTNLQPYFHDLNFSLKNNLYKPKKVVPKYIPEKPKPPPSVRHPPPRQVFRPQQVTQAVRSRMLGPGSTVIMRPAGPQTVRTILQQKPISPAQRFSQQRQVRPPVTVARQPIPPVVAPKTPRAAAPAAHKPDMSGFEVCELCGGYVKDRQALRIHFYYAHKVEMPLAIFNRQAAPLVCEVCQSRFWTTQGLSKHKSSLRHYGPSTSPITAANNQQCFMCMRRVQNLFVHIEQVHGMTMKDLVAMKKCIMCGITAPDRRQLETHMASQHGVLIKANDFLGPEKQPSAGAPRPAGNVPPKPAPPGTPASKPGQNTPAMIRNNLCVFCQVQFPDNIQLTMHCIKNHATCNACGMVVASAKQLVNHICKKKSIDCRVCGIKRLSGDSYAVHIKKHVKNCKIRLRKMTESDIAQAKEKIKKLCKPQVICLDSDEDVDVEGTSNDKPDNVVKNGHTDPTTDSRKRRADSEDESTETKSSPKRQKTADQGTNLDEDVLKKDQDECQAEQESEGEQSGNQSAAGEELENDSKSENGIEKQTESKENESESQSEDMECEPENKSVNEESESESKGSRSENQSDSKESVSENQSETKEGEYENQGESENQSERKEGESENQSEDMECESGDQSESLEGQSEKQADDVPS